MRNTINSVETAPTENQGRRIHNSLTRKKNVVRNKFKIVPGLELFCIITGGVL